MAYSTKGTKYDDVLYGADLKSDDYHDIISGRQGNDWISGGLSRDNLLGGAGNDTLIGGVGDDLLTGNLGDAGHTDAKSGAGPGADTFLFYAGDGHDVIGDFEIGIDTLVFGNEVGTLTFTQNSGIPGPDPITEGPRTLYHWGAEWYYAKTGTPANPIYTTITYDGGQIEVLGVHVNSLAELNS